MVKVQVGHEWDIPEGYEVAGPRCGGYALAIKNQELYILGKRELNISTIPISFSGVLPFTKEGLSSGNITGDLEDLFIFEPDTIYFAVRYEGNGNSFIFKTKREALYFCELLVDIKVEALEQRIKNQRA